jgi:hypothetical protein
MERWFIAQAVTGEDIDLLKEETNKIYSAIKSLGDQPYSSVLEKSVVENGESKMIHVLKQIEERDKVLSIIRSEIKSMGMSIEVGYAKGKNKEVIVALKEGIENSYIPPLANNLIKYENIEELCEEIKKLK